jgi:glucokinase
LFAGFDVGGTNIKVGVVDAEGRRVAHRSLPTEEERGSDDAARRMAAAYRELLAESGVAAGDVVRAGLATPGPMDIPAGKLLKPGNLPHWHDQPVRDQVSAATGLPVTFANDANAAAYGEFWCGRGRDAQSMVMFTLGTGVGGGIITEGQLIEGRHSCGGELGHILIDPSPTAPLNTLGIRGSLEGYCGSYGVLARAEAAMAAGDPTSLRKRLEQGAELTPLMIAEEAESGDQLALDVVLETARYLALGVVTMVHAIDPEMVLIGGAMTFGGEGSRLGERFLARVREESQLRMIESLRDRVTISFASLGGAAGYYGAAGLACREHQR